MNLVPNQTTDIADCEDNLKTFVHENKIDSSSVAGIFVLTTTSIRNQSAGFA